MVGRIPAPVTLLVFAENPRKVDRFDHVGDKQRKMAFRKPLSKIGWQQQELIWLVAAERLAHAASLRISPCVSMTEFAATPKGSRGTVPTHRMERCLESGPSIRPGFRPVEARPVMAGSELLGVPVGRRPTRNPERERGAAVEIAPGRGHGRRATTCGATRPIAAAAPRSRSGFWSFAAYRWLARPLLRQAPSSPTPEARRGPAGPT